ncbi:glycosyltransferase family 32 protein [Taibaiella koreensis]|uniref:glycosyltransferase family 32 protein n=1 Tax=Taibaiella koreensis TaxID=1268548 RepID=UPI000E59AB16|nr:glycosyltransferase [Taibaiella koreensis]
MIPLHLHQTWKDEQIPEHLEHYVQSWKSLHPDWAYTLWTDEMNDRFIATHYPEFLPVYERYPTAIQRVDAVRYFILLQQGGLFIDLDFECLRPISPLLKDTLFVAGLEPAAHAIAHHKAYIISNAFMAGAPGSGFLQYLCGIIKTNDYYRYSRERGFNAVLDCAGPFMLSRAYERFPAKEEIRIVDHQLLYPLHKNPVTGTIDAAHRSDPRIREKAYAIHHYWGSWWQAAE